MKLSHLKTFLKDLDQVKFVLPDGKSVPEHFHVTEVGKIEKHFIDCGGTVRKEEVINFQLWTANDYDHRLSTNKLSSIINLSEKTLNLGDNEIEVEFQSETIGKYGLDFQDGVFLLTSKQTDCLAKDNCGIPPEKLKVNLKELVIEQAACTPGGGCC
ncbi:MAG: DUF6428 family protein [Bacteroidia bacterium]